MKKATITTNRAPAAIGPYSQAVRVGDTVYLAGQIPLKPDGSGLAEGDMGAMVCQVFDNLRAVAEAAGGSLNDIVKLNVYLTDLSHFSVVNEWMARYFQEPYPARAAVQVSALPRDAAVEMDAVMSL